MATTSTSLELMETEGAELSASQEMDMLATPEMHTNVSQELQSFQLGDGNVERDTGVADTESVGMIPTSDDGSRAEYPLFVHALMTYWKKKGDPWSKILQTCEEVRGIMKDTGHSPTIFTKILDQLKDDMNRGKFEHLLIY